MQIQLSLLIVECNIERSGALYLIWQKSWRVRVTWQRFNQSGNSIMRCKKVIACLSLWYTKLVFITKGIWNFDSDCRKIDFIHILMVKGTYCLSCDVIACVGVFSKWGDWKCLFCRSVMQDWPSFCLVNKWWGSVCTVY